MHRLIRGIQQFQQESFPPRRGLFERLAAGQAPEALFIACSDSRVDPNLLTGSKPGDLFVLRNAGNLVPPYGAAAGGEAATVEFAVTTLGVEDIIVCGHSHCGAMEALLAPESLAGMPALASWLGHAATTRRILREDYGHLTGDRLLAAAVEVNVLVQLEHLRTLPAVAARLAGGGVRLHGWVYQIATGEVFAFDLASGQFVAVGDPSAGYPGGAVSGLAPPARTPPGSRRS